MSADISLDFTCPVPIAGTDEILLGHGSGGKLTARLIEQTIVPALRNPILEVLDDQALLPIRGDTIAFTTDSFVVTPIFFPGGDIGELAVNGTVNDLAMGGAMPRFLSLALILEEGFPIEDLKRILASVRRAAERAGVVVVTGDTKVVGRGAADQIFINTAGIGFPRPGANVTAARVRPGDAVLLSGTIGDHGMAILTKREGLELEGHLESDTAPLKRARGGHARRAPRHSRHARSDARRPRRHARRDRHAAEPRHRGRRAGDSGHRSGAGRVRAPRSRSAVRRE